MNQLLKAAKDRSDTLRQQSDKAHSAEPHKDVVAQFLDYASEKVTHPPLKSVEQNLLAFQKYALDIRKAILESSTATQEKGQCSDLIHKLANVVVPTLVPVQPARHTLIKHSNP